MENIVFDRNYERADKEDARAAAIFDRVYAPGGFMDEITKKLDAIPKVIVPKDKENYEYLLDLCDKFAQRHHGRIHGVVDYEHWDSRIDLYLRLLEFDDEEDMAVLKDIGERAHYCCISTEQDGCFHVHIMINYFEELMSEEYAEYLKYETLYEDEELAAMVGGQPLSSEDEAVAQLVKELLDRIEDEAHMDQALVLRAVMDHMVKEENAEISFERVAAFLALLLEKLKDETDDEV